MSGRVTGELMEELYGLTETCLFATCWEGHDDLEQAFVDWAKQDFKAALASSDESPVKLEKLVRETGDDVMADFIGQLEPELQREALLLVSEYLEESYGDDAVDLKARIDDAAGG